MNITDFWSNDYLKTKEIKVEDLGTVTIKELSALDFEDLRKHEGSELKMAAHTVVRSVLNDDGVRMFTDKDLDKLLKTVSAKVLVKISSEVIDLSDITEHDPK